MMWFSSMTGPSSMAGLSSPTPWRAAMRLALLVVLALFACAGIVFGALMGSMLGVALSALVPGWLALRIVMGQP